MKTNKDQLEVFRDNLYEIMRQNHWTALCFATRCEMSYETFRRLLVGETQNAWMSTFIKISEGTGIPLSVLFDDGKKSETQMRIAVNKMYSDMNEIYSKIGEMLGKE